MTKRVKHWCSTIFDLEVDPKTWPDVSYAVYQLELCPTTGREHLQLYVRFGATKRMTWVQKLYKGHWEAVRSPKHKRAYCMKEDSRIAGPWEIGDWSVTPTQGSKFHEILSLIKDGNPERIICDKFPGMFRFFIF